MPKPLSDAALQRIAGAFGYEGAAAATSVEEIVKEGGLPETFAWEPTACISVGNDRLLVHLLQSAELPSLVTDAAKGIPIGQAIACHVIAVAGSVEENTPSGIRVVPAAWAAGQIAKVCTEAGMGLGFIENDSVWMVFPPRFQVPAKCAVEDEETGHIPSWLYTKVTDLEAFSPYLRGAFQTFAREYRAVTRRKRVDYDTECKLLDELAWKIARGDRRLFVPVGELQVLREYERHGANRGARDHYFHTFNNLIMGYYILGSLKRPDEPLCAVDEFIEPEKHREARAQKIDEWEALWLLTCLFHDPAYIAEKVHSGTFRFSYGVVEDESSFGGAIQEASKEKIADLWQSEFRVARRWLGDLYARVLKKWKAGRESGRKARFEDALGRAYFDGRRVSHSLVSGLRLIQHCRHNKVEQRNLVRGTARTACTVAALSMMFHDLRCRQTLRDAGIPPFGFQKLPYAAVLMFVDCLQDDRRDIGVSRFRRHGVLTDLRVDSTNRSVTAEVCLREVDVERWSGRIWEYEDVLSWVNSSAGVRFAIDYRARAGIVLRH